LADTDYHFQDHESHQVVIFPPELNDVQWDRIETIGNEVIAALEEITTPKVLMDIAALEYVGSAMVALVVRVGKAVRDQGGKMVVVNKHEQVFEVFRLARLESLWPIVGSEEEARIALGLPDGKRSGASSGTIVKIVVVLLALLGAAAVAYIVMKGGVGN